MLPVWLYNGNERLQLAVVKCVEDTAHNCSTFVIFKPSHDTLQIVIPLKVFFSNLQIFSFAFKTF